MKALLVIHHTRTVEPVEIVGELREFGNTVKFVDGSTLDDVPAQDLYQMDSTVAPMCMECWKLEARVYELRDKIKEKSLSKLPQ